MHRNVVKVNNNFNISLVDDTHDHLLKERWSIAQAKLQPGVLI